MTNIKDCKFIQKIIKKNCNADLPLRDCNEMWNDHSEDYCAGWLIVNDDPECIDEIINLYNRIYSK